MVITSAILLLLPTRLLPEADLSPLIRNKHLFTSEAQAGDICISLVVLGET